MAGRERIFGICAWCIRTETAQRLTVLSVAAILTCFPLFSGAQKLELRQTHIEMDWQGQKRAEMLMQIFLVVSAVVAFGLGYLMRDFRLMMLIYAGGVVLTAFITVPNWPFFNHHPLKWLDPSEAEKHPKPQVSNITSSSSSKKKASKNK
ncbi:hypothetical protein LUZ63_017027 [Rhynchospora breviuscula]|uniref:Signal peptidase complex subunit 1 n=1 Tax=Rhynchospora breviuscula TaxID=2022672 RepID=A0A9Q0C1P2_9POAL|nr:hypothetical protein LUZ63_017027 [Rhynchospora breviuscula]